jgi:hypothetical protein
VFTALRLRPPGRQEKADHDHVHDHVHVNVGVDVVVHVLLVGVCKLGLRLVLRRLAARPPVYPGGRVYTPIACYRDS